MYCVHYLETELSTWCLEVSLINVQIYHEKRKGNHKDKFIFLGLKTDDS